MTYFFNEYFLEQLRATPTLMNGATVRLTLYAQAPLYQQDDPRYTRTRTVAELTAMVGWREVNDTAGYPLTTTMTTTSATKGNAVYVLFPYTAGPPVVEGTYPFTGLGPCNVRAISVVYVGNVGGMTNPIIFTTNRMMPTQTRFITLASGDAMTAHPDYAYSQTPPYRWLFSWAIPSTGDPGVSPYNRLTNSEFDGAGVAISGHGTLASGWTLGGAPPAVYNFSLQANGQGGATDQFQRVTADLTSGTSYRIVQRVLTVVSSRSHSASVSVKGTLGAATASLNVDVLDISGQIVQHNTQAFTVTASWATATLNFTTPATGYSAVAWVEVGGIAAGTTLDLDKFVLNELVPATVRPIEGPLNIVKGMPLFESGHTQHVWVYPNRVNYIANPSFEVAETTPRQWASNGTVTRVSGGGPGGGSWSGQFAGPTPVVAESNKFPCPNERRWTIQLMAKGTGTLRVGLVYWDSTYELTAINWGDEEWDLNPDAFVRIATIRDTYEAHEVMLRLEASDSPLIIDRVLVESGTLLDWWYFDGNSTYGARDDFSWYGGIGRMGNTFSLWYNNKNAVLGRLFAWDLGNDILITDEELAKQGFVYQWVPAGISVVPHFDVLYPNDQTKSLPPKGPILPYKQSPDDPNGVENPWIGPAIWLGVDNGLHNHAADNVGNVLPPPAVLSSLDAFHTTTSDAPTLSYIVLAPLNASHTVVSDTPTITAIATCTDVLTEPFNSLNAWTKTGGVVLVSGRNGTAAQVPGNFSDNASYTIPAINESDTVTIGFAFKVSGVGSETHLIDLMNDGGATQQVFVTWNSAGALLLYVRGTGGVFTSAGGLIVANTWYYLELKVRLHDTAGSYDLRLNGTSIASATNVDTKATSTKTTFDTVKMVVNGFARTYDDLYISTGSGCPFKGDQNLGSDTILLEPFNDFTTNPGWVQSGTSPFSIATGRTGNGASGAGSSATRWVRYDIPSGNQSDYLTVGFAFKINNATGTRAMVEFGSDNATVAHTWVEIPTDGSIAVRTGGSAGVLTATAAAGSVPINTFIYFEIAVRLHDTLGTVTMRVNGTQVAATTNVDTKFGGTKTVFDYVRLLGPASGITNIYDDLYISTGPGAVFKGSITI